MPFFLALVLLLAPHSAAAARLHGRVSAPPSLATAGSLSVAVDAWACGNEGRIADPRLVIGEGRGIADVVVRVVGPADAPPSHPEETTHSTAAKKVHRRILREAQRL